MKVSFIIPAHNEEAIIGECIESIQREIARGSYEGEILVADNASTDRTREVAASYGGVRVVEETWKGPNRARQAGFKVSTGDFIANIDADCIVPAGWLSIAMNELKRHKNLVAVSGPYMYSGLPFTSHLFVWLFYAITFLMYLVSRFVFRSGSVIQGGNLVVRREALEKIGGYNTAIEFYGDDTDTARRLSSVGAVKWTFRLRIRSSGRRLKGVSLITTGFQYALNYFSVLLVKKPYTVKYHDVRPK